VKTFSVKQIAEMLNTNPETVRRWIRDGKLNAVQVSRKYGNVVTETELDRFIRNTPKYMSKISAAASLATLPTIAGISALAGGIVASAILGYCKEKSKADVRIRANDFKAYLKETVVKLNNITDQKRELIKQTETEIEEITRRIDQYNYLLEHEQILLETLENVNDMKGENQNE